MSELRIAVLVSVGAHPVNGAARWSRNDGLALTMALALQQGDVDVIHAGNPAEPALRDYLALGARLVEAIETPPGRDVLDALVERVRGYDIVLCGTRSEAGEASGMLPYRLARALHMPLLPAVLTAQVLAGGIVTQQFLPKGRRREIAAVLPAVLVVHPLAPFEARHVYARQRAGHVAARVAGVVGAPLPTAQVERVSAPAARLTARESRSGRMRLLAATTTESRGGAVITQGSPVEKAQAVMAYLRRHSLIDY